ncbi:hypothetical protein HMPREF9466_00163 [Fusobacterium necrophorum subsp. funduliforme 1_1_36S]|nr:hypothetical protein HMPREF9466_00163 [Fusobacterium necrophorum subsp. funduliforme 1_1_36S]
MEEEHYRIHLEIVKKQEFQSYSLKEGLIFQDIKNFLLGKEGKYNRIQANILASFFKQKQNTLAIIERGRGVQTVLKTIVLFAKSQQQKYQILEEWDGRETIQENCSFLVFLFPKSIEKIPSFSFSCRVLILSEKISLYRVTIKYGMNTGFPSRFTGFRKKKSLNMNEFFPTVSHKKSKKKSWRNFPSSKSYMPQKIYWCICKTFIISIIKCYHFFTCKLKCVIF